ncbi:hypothetical protein C8R45DRAFT_944721 [Mycena sanguinolenta]|nr:hypothetical protein C8R45DRAFT_944721 [Mycena sanguinolenta]
MLIRTRRFADALFFSQLQIQNTDEHGEPLVTLPRGGTIFKAPSDELLSPEIEEKYATTAPSTMAYTAALAAFKLWGRSPQTSQLLRIAVRTNPAILAKIIGRRTQPTEAKNGPGDFNGPNEAHDYFRPGCHAKEVGATQFKRCAACRLVVYCGPDCQKEDWRRHKPECTKEAERRRVMKNAWEGIATGKTLKSDHSIAARGK